MMFFLVRLNVFLLTTKHTKATKVSDIDIFKLLNFVLFVTFVVIDPASRNSPDVDTSLVRSDTSTAVLRFIGYRVSRLRMNGT